MTKFLTKAAMAATVATSLFAAPALAAPPATGSFDANATIVKPVTMTQVDDLDFGITTMNPTLTSATVSVGDADGSVAVCSSIVMLTCSGGNPAKFDLTSGVRNQTVQISFDSPPSRSTTPRRAIRYPSRSIRSKTCSSTPPVPAPSTSAAPSPSPPRTTMASTAPRSTSPPTTSDRPTDWNRKGVAGDGDPFSFPPIGSGSAQGLTLR